MNDTVQLSSRFREVVTSDAELHAVVGQPPDRSIAKVIHSIDGHARQFIAHAPFVFVASAGKDGMIDVSPKGDPAGFVKVLNDRTLAIPDRLGNRQIDTFRNVLRNPNVGLIFLIPGVTYTLRGGSRLTPRARTRLSPHAIDVSMVSGKLSRWGRSAELALIATHGSRLWWTATDRYPTCRLRSIAR